MAYTSLMAFAAATCPKSYGSSTIGVKKSVVWTIAVSSFNLYTPASSFVSSPTSTFGFGVLAGRLRNTFARSVGPILHPHPPLDDNEVNFIVWLLVICHLPFLLKHSPILT